MSIIDWAEWLARQGRATIAPVTDADVRAYAARVGLDLDEPGGAGERHREYCHSMVYQEHCRAAVRAAQEAGTAYRVPPR